MKTLRELSLRPATVVEPQTSLAEASRLMEDDPLHLVVLVGDETYMGLFDRAALESPLIPAGVDRETLAVGPYVHPQRAVGRLEMTVDEALALMQRRGVDIMPVVGGAIFRGLLTRADLEAAR